MKANFFRNYLLGAGAAALFAAGFASCASDDFGSADSQRKVKLSVNISRDYDATRSTLTEVDGNLNCVWESTDQVLVTDNKGNKLGVLAIKEGAGQPTATFDGILQLAGIPDGTTDFNFIYLGRNVKEPLKVADPAVRSFASQSGDFKDMEASDFFTSTQSVEINGAMAYTKDMGLSRKIAFGHFELIFPEGVNYNGETVTISGAGINNAVSISMTNKIDFTEGPITVPSKDFYITLLPKPGVQMAPEFSVTVNGVKYIGTLDARTVAPSAFLRLSQGVGVPVKMTVDKSVDHSKNPLRKWAKGNLVYNPATGTSYVSTDEYAGGSLYQWGRSHGFSDYTEPYTWDASLNSYKYGGYGLNSFSAAMGLQYMNGRYYYKTGSLYLNTNPLKNDTKRDWFFIAKPTQATSYFNSSVYNDFLGYMSTADYLVNVNADYWPSTFSGGGNTWSERAKAMNEKDVCPAGYRLPTDEDYMEIFPAGTQLSSESTFKTTTTTSDVRELADGSKYAISWSWESHGQQQVLVIKALMVPADFTKSQITASTWSDANVEVRRFPATGGIKAYYHQHKYKNGYIVTLDFMQPMPFGKWNVYLRTSPVVNISYENISDAGKNYQGGYWMGDQKKIATFRLDNGSRFGSENGTSYVGRILTPAQDAHAIRCIIINP